MSSSLFSQPKSAAGPESGPIHRAPAMPDLCNHTPGCDKTAVVAIAVVESAGRRKSGLLAHFATAQGVLLPGVEWIAWVSPCSDCYELILQRLGKSRLEDELETVGGFALGFLDQIREACRTPTPERAPNDRAALARQAENLARATRLPYAEGA